MIKKLLIILESLLAVVAVASILLGIWTTHTEQWLLTAGTLGGVAVVLMLVISNLFE